MIELQPPLDERRAEPRYQVTVPVRIVGTDQNGYGFNDDAITCTISSRGLSFLIRSQVAPGAHVSVLILNARGAGEIAVFEVMWSKPEGEQYLHGARLVEKNLWAGFFQKVTAR